MKDQKTGEPAGDRPEASKPSVKWDDSRMQTAYANVVNAASTREEVSLLFGTNQTWNAGEDQEYVVQLSNRIVLNPYAAKRLQLLLSKLMQEYERRFGPLKADAGERLGG